MKTSSGLLLGVLFTLVVVIIAVVIYFNTSPEEQPQTSNDPGPSPTLPTISDLIIAQTFSPDGNEPYTIEPYTIEPYTASDIIDLSKNVNFTLTWKNGSGFKESGVLQINVYHIVETTAQKKVLRNTSASTSNFGESSVSISGLNKDETAADETTGPYSFVGNNFFKIVAVMPTGTADVTLYDGVSTKTRATNLGGSDGKRITDDDLVATIGMATPETITFTPRLDNTEGQSFGKSISNKRYDFFYYTKQSNGEKKSVFENVRLVPNDKDGIKFKLEKSGPIISGFLKGINILQPGLDLETATLGYELTQIGKQDYINVFEFNNDSSSSPIIVHISESKESNNKKGHDKVIMLKQIIANKDYYLFGDHFDLLGSKNNEDDFFKRNIYIKEST